MDETVKKALIFGSIFVVIGVLAILIPNLIWKRPNNHDESKWGVVNIQMADGPNGWSQHHMEVARSVLPELNRLGPTFVLGGNGPRAIRIVNVDLTDPRTKKCTTHKGVARFVTNSITRDSHIEIDPTCTEGDNEFRTALMHEVGHFLGMQHVCTLSDKNPEEFCSPVGRGLAVMNPSLFNDTPSTSPSDNELPGDSVFEIQDLDAKEFLRTNQPIMH